MFIHGGYWSTGGGGGLEGSLDLGASLTAWGVL